MAPASGARALIARALRRLGPPLLALATLGVDGRAPRIGETLESAPTREVSGTTCVGANDLARLLRATKFWHPEVRKLILRAGPHRIQLTAEDPFVVVDDGTVALPAPVMPVGGELQVPVALADLLPRDSTLARLVFDPRRRVLVVAPPSGVLGSARVVVQEGRTRLVFEADRPEEVVVVSRARDHFRVRFGGFFSGSLPDALPAAALVQRIRPIGAAAGSAFEMAVSRQATGFRVVRDTRARRVVLEFTREPSSEFTAFAPEGPPGPRDLRVVVLDPGHGGRDAGFTAGGLVEKDLTLALARQLESEIGRRLRVRVVLTRTEDRDVPVEARAEIANRARADLVVSLHFDGFPSAAAGGATAYVPPATYSSAGFTGGAGSLTVLAWREAATRHAVESRALGEAILSSLELRGDGPILLRELLPYPLLGVDAPGLLLECATLTARADRERVGGRAGMAELAETIADGIQAYQRNE